MPEVNVILDILKAILQVRPEYTFVKSLFDQYCNRGSLSKKQLEGLHSIASKMNDIPLSRLATLEAIIKKKPTRYKSEVSVPAIENKKDDEIGKILNDILVKFPLHKRVLYLQSKYNNSDPLNALEISEIQKFNKLLL